MLARSDGSGVRDGRSRSATGGCQIRGMGGARSPCAGSRGPRRGASIERGRKAAPVRIVADRARTGDPGRVTGVARQQAPRSRGASGLPWSQMSRRFPPAARKRAREASGGVGIRWPSPEASKAIARARMRARPDRCRVTVPMAPVTAESRGTEGPEFGRGDRSQASASGRTSSRRVRCSGVRASGATMKVWMPKITARVVGRRRKVWRSTRI